MPCKAGDSRYIVGRYYGFRGAIDCEFARWCYALGRRWNNGADAILEFVGTL